MNQISKDLLERVRSEPHLSRHANDAAFLLVEMKSRWFAHRNAVLWDRALWIWGLYDETALREEFFRRLDGKGFNTGFEFDISDIDEDDEPWAAAYQLAIDDWTAGRRSIEEPDATLEDVQRYIALVPAIQRRSGQAPVQQSLFSQLST